MNLNWLLPWRAKRTIAKLESEVDRLGKETERVRGILHNVQNGDLRDAAEKLAVAHGSLAAEQAAHNLTRRELAIVTKGKIGLGKQAAAQVEALTRQLESEQHEHHQTRQSLRETKARHDEKDMHLKQLTAFVMVAHRIPLPHPIGSIGARLQRR